MEEPFLNLLSVEVEFPDYMDMFNFFQIKEQSNRTLNPNMTLEKVNELAIQLEFVVNGSETDTKTVTQILSHMSEIEITNSQTVEVSFRNCFH